MPKYLLSRGVRRAKRALTGLSGISRLRSTIPERGELVLARDLAGQFPLFLAQSGDRTGTASMPSGLRSFIGQPDLNKQRLALTLCDVGHDDYRQSFCEGGAGSPRRNRSYWQGRDQPPVFLAWPLALSASKRPRLG